MSKCGGLYSDSPNECGENIEIKRIGFKEFPDFKKEEEKAVKEERYEDAAMYRDGNIPSSYFDTGVHWFNK